MALAHFISPRSMSSVSFLLSSLKRHLRCFAHRLGQRLLEWIRPKQHSLGGGLLTDLTRTKPELLAETALLGPQRLILRRQVNRPAYTRTDRLLLVVLARATRHWKQALCLST